MKKESKGYIVDYFISIISIVLFIIIIGLVLIAVFDNNTEGEAPVGSYNVIDMSDDWELVNGNEIRNISLPYWMDINVGQIMFMTKTLPDNLSDNMSLMIRASMEDMYIYVDGELRSEYSSKSINGLSYYTPSAYVVTKLNREDSGKELKIEICFKAQGLINEVTLGYGNDAWYPILQNSFLVNLAAIIVLILGFILTVSMLVFSKALGDINRAANYLGFLMIDVALWVISESTIRQFVFNRPSLTEIFAYLTVELMGAIACMYFDEVQHGKFHKIYRIVECVIILQLLINLSLYVTKVCYMYKTLFLSHLWTAIGIIIVIGCIVKDCIDEDIKKYKYTALGMACFVAMAIVELAGFYITRFHVLGTYICVGLVLLMIFTIIQMLFDEISSSREREEKNMKMINNTIETIAGSIDAKDEYTGGHSERVGIYAERLAREIAVDYGFSEEDILRIRYIGLVHDIGKLVSQIQY